MQVLFYGSGGMLYPICIRLQVLILFGSWFCTVCHNSEVQ